MATIAMAGKDVAAIDTVGIFQVGCISLMVTFMATATCWLLVGRIHAAFVVDMTSRLVDLVLLLVFKMELGPTAAGIILTSVLTAVILVRHVVIVVVTANSEYHCVGVHCPRGTLF